MSPDYEVDFTEECLLELKEAQRKDERCTKLLGVVTIVGYHTLLIAIGWVLAIIIIK